MKLNNHHKAQESERQSLLCCCPPEWKASICLPDSDPTPSSNERWLEAGLMLGGPSSVQEPSLGTRLSWEHQQSASRFTTKFLAVETVRGGASPCYGQRLHTLGSACVFLPHSFINEEWMSTMTVPDPGQSHTPWEGKHEFAASSCAPQILLWIRFSGSKELHGSSWTQFPTVNATVLHRDK